MQVLFPASVNNIVQISAGDLHSIVRKTDNTVIAWDRVAGLTNYGQSNVPSGLRAIQISAGTLHSLAIKTDSTVESWEIIIILPFPILSEMAE